MSEDASQREVGFDMRRFAYAGLFLVLGLGGLGPVLPIYGQQARSSDESLFNKF
jgi:hypothetical protein